MRNQISFLIVGLIAGVSVLPMAFAQAPLESDEVILSTDYSELTSGAHPPGWKTCPRCQSTTDRRRAEAQYQVEGHPFDPHDLSGVWGFNGFTLAFAVAPPMTEEGQERYEATRGTFSPDGEPLFQSSDPMVNCDPIGMPRYFQYNYGFEFVMLPDRVIQFQEWGHTFRVIWTDGRKLPENPPELRFLGWNIGYWEGDTFVVESNGYDDGSWISPALPTRTNTLSGYGWPHSDEMRLVERYRRTDYTTLETTVTVIDPRIYTEPWETQGTTKLVPDTEIWEYLCVPSDAAEYNRTVVFPTVEVEPEP